METFNFKILNKEEYQTLCEGRDIPLTQNYFYGEWQEKLDRKVFRYSITWEPDTQAGFFQVIKYSSLSGMSYLYIPHGPVFLKNPPPDFWINFKKFCLELTKQENAIFLRFDRYTWSPGLQVTAERSGLSCQDQIPDGLFYNVPKYLYDGNFQPKFETVLDLTKTEEEILVGMKKVNRYTVRQAEKLGVTVGIVTENYLSQLDKFYELIENTARRDEFSHNSKDYYGTIFKECEQTGNSFMTIASYKGEIMLINLAVTYGDEAFFLYSGSEDIQRNIGYTYLAQWEAIKYAKKIGLKKYNFGAVIKTPNEYPLYSKWRGFSDFKLRFGGEIREYSDFYDIVANKSYYYLYLFRRWIKLLVRGIKS